MPVEEMELDGVRNGRGRPREMVLFLRAATEVCMAGGVVVAGLSGVGEHILKGCSEGAVSSITMPSPSIIGCSPVSPVAAESFEGPVSECSAARVT